ncbi:TRAP transporter substrate-binding protein [Quisquiliibacterium transsilvanicum]|uniref:TRAP-type mannitol/chloroaromatic compound transport system substrate-binding protein n=1 Tax=Quisquiliibacterium transsilvanicum TaxID=1549638 RepID=A0A7W8HKJ9_9BURK|nr:TRAP transporter substrate-binding protein [Quisquiliibacterium transsilvanicum]MBB5272835.1 TRAP-type mannitol/chloroaromatic compound transport system substrate-binding protein [Quisquiliibacterium transsilvanicum]
MTGNAPPRRRFIATAGAGATTLGFPMVARAQPVTLRFQSTWPQKDIFHEFANDFAQKVNEMSGGRLRIEVLPAGAVVKAFDLLDGVAKGVLDGGHGLLAYWYSKNSALALWGTGPAFGMDANMLLAWHRYGGGKELLEQIYSDLNLGVVSFVYGPMPTQPLGWFKRPVTRPEQFKGMRFRTVGLSIDLFTRMGALVNALPGAEVVPAMDRGLLDGAEFSNASSDRLLGFPDVAKVCMLQSFHQPAEAFEILFNRRRFESLPADLRAIVRHAVDASSADMSWKAIDRFSRDHLDLQQKQGVKFHRTPETILRSQLKLWDEIAEAKAAENPMFRNVYESQRVFAARTTRWQGETQVDFRLAYDHYFAPRKN